MFRAVLVLCLLLTAGHALAQNSSAVAEVLFEQGRDAMQAGNMDVACQRFRESNRLDPAVGTLFNLANCEEKRGKLATAWELFRLTLEKLPPRDSRESVARQHLTALEPRLPRLTLALQPGAPPDTSVTVGSLELQGGSFGIPLPIDPGKQVLLVHAAGRASRTYEVVLGEGESKRIEIAPGPPAAASGAENLRERVDSTPSRGGVSLGKTGSAQSHLRRSGTGRTVGFIVGGAGVLAVATGAVTGVMTLNEKKTVDDHCSSALSLCDRTGKEAADRGRSLALVSTIAFITGGVALGIGGYLLLTSSPEMPAQVTAAVAPGSAQIGLETAW